MIFKMAAPMKVLLGIKDEVITSNKSHFLTNKIGGIPDLTYEDQKPNPVCKLCEKSLHLLVQIYCPLEGSKYHRTLYIFACVSQRCWNQNDSWCVLRSQKLAVSTQTKLETKGEEASITTKDWCQDADDWGGDADDWSGDVDDWVEDDDDWGDASCREMLGLPASSSCVEENIANTSEQPYNSAVDDHKDTNECASKLSNLRLSKDTVLHTPVEFMSYYINVFEEPMEQFVTKHEEKLLKDYEQREGLDFMEWHDTSNDKGKKSSKNEKYEKFNASHGDLVFEKFLKRTALCPEQCLRYCWSGGPLYIRKPEQSSLTQAPCQYCGSNMVYELQLMPALVRQLKDKSNSDKTVEFGVVLVYTCSESCWNDDDTSCREEMAIVQSDPDQDLLNSKEF